MPRDSRIDALKVFGLYLVILGHWNGLPEYLANAVYAFHMPLFFFLSGYLTNRVHLEVPFGDFLQKNAHRLIVPYLLLGILTFLPPWVLLENQDWEFSAVLTRLSFLGFGLLYGVGDHQTMGHNIALWFLPSLFCARLLLYGIGRIDSVALRIGLSLLAAVAGLAAAHFAGFRLPWSLDSSLLATPFIVAGFELHGKSPRLTRHTAAVSIVAVLGYTAAIIWNGDVDLRRALIRNPALFYVGAFSGIMISLTLMSLLRSWSIWTKLAAPNLTTYGLHTLTMALMYGLINAGWGLDYSITRPNLVIVLGLSVLVLLVSWLAAVVLERLIPGISPTRDAGIR